MFDDWNDTQALCNNNRFHHSNATVTNAYEIILRGYDSFVEAHDSIKIFPECSSFSSLQRYIDFLY